MIWVFLVLLVLSYVFFFALMRAVAESNHEIEEKPDPTEPRIYVTRGPYDWERGKDFDD